MVTDMRKMKDSGVDWIGEIPENYEVKRIKACIALRYGGCWGEDEQEDNSYLCIRIADFDFNTQSVKNTASTKRSYSDNQLRNGLLKDGDIIIEKSGGGEKTPVGRTVIYDATKYPKAMFANFCDALRPSSEIYNKFFAYCLKAFYQNVDMHLFFNQTTGLQNLNMQKYLCAKIPFSNKQEQKAIADFLDTKCSEIDALSADIQSEIDTLEAYKRSVITEAVTKGLDKNVEMKDSGTGWMGTTPKSWNRTRVKYCLYEKNIRSATGTEEPLSMSQKFGIIPTSEIDVPHIMASYVGAKIAVPNDLVLNKLKAHLGVFSVSKYKGLVSPDYAVYGAYKNTNPKYLEYLFGTELCINEFKKYITGVGQGLSRLYTDDLFSIAVSLPNRDEQDRIVEYLNHLCNETAEIVSRKQEQLEVLADYKKSLIYEYVTGKKEVS